MSGKDLTISAVLLILVFGGLFIFFRAYFTSKPESPIITEQKTLGESKAIIVVSPSPASSKTKTSTSAAAVYSPSLSPTAKPSPSAKPSPGKPSYVIAVFGDSMVDTMGENLDYLDKSLKITYPNTKFNLYNYGIGSQNVIEGNNRFQTPFSYKTRNYPAIDQIGADIIIISTFAYNPLSPYDKVAYLDSLRELISKAKNTKAQVYLFAEIAPLQDGFGKGVGGVNWDKEKTDTHVGYILSNLEGAINLASQTKTPLINAFAKSQVDGKYGNKTYVGTHDGIHPSIEGEVFMADLIAQTLKLP